MKVKLVRNLRRSILQGQPWVFREALESVPKDGQARLCQVIDGKGELGWAIFDPQGTLTLRVLSTEKPIPNESFFNGRFARAWKLRQSVRRPETTAYRLFNGEGDLLPGLVCDIYGSTAVLQFDGPGPGQFWNKNQIADWLLTNTHCKSVVEKSRRNEQRGLELISGQQCSGEEVILENGAKFRVQIEKGQKTGFFLDQRDNRQFVREMSVGKSVLNLFSYSGGFSINAGLGGATRVASLDIAKGAIELAEENWTLNQLPKERHQGIAADVFDYLKSNTELWDHLIVDPPSMSHSESQKPAAINKYIELFVQAGKRVKVGGELSLSSCSSHIGFEDFFEIIRESLSQMRRTGQILRVSGQGPDHPFPHSCPELRYLKFVHLVFTK